MEEKDETRVGRATQEMKQICSIRLKAIVREKREKGEDTSPFSGSILVTHVRVCLFLESADMHGGTTDALRELELFLMVKKRSFCR